MLRKISSEVKFFMAGWLVFWFLSMGIYILVLKPQGITYIDNIHITIPYFICSALVGALIFKLPKLLEANHKGLIQLLILSLCSALFILLPPFIDTFMPLQEKMISKIMEIQFYYPLFKLESGSTKMADIIFQQTLIMTLVLYLKKHFTENKKVIKLFTIIFFFLHTPLVLFFSLTSLVFIIPSLLAGIIFSYLILKFKFGILYSYLVHMSFYISVGLIYRII